MIRVDSACGGCGRRTRAGASLRCRRLAARPFGLHADQRAEIVEIEQLAVQVGRQQRARLAIDVRGTAAHIGRTDAPVQIVHGVAVALQHQVPLQPVGRRRGQWQQQERVEIGQRLAFDAQLRVDAGNVGGVGNRAFDPQPRATRREIALQRKRHARLLEAQHFARQCSAREAGTVVFAIEGVARGVAVVGRLGIGIPDLVLDSGIEGADLHVQLHWLAVVHIAQRALVDRQRADAQRARRLVRRVRQHPVPGVVFLPLQHQVGLGQCNARDQYLVGQVTQGD